jgi:hypothetical protein
MTHYAVNIPEGRVGNWSIQKATGDSLGFGVSTLFSQIYGFNLTCREEPYGEYTFLCVDSIGPIMMDTTHEYAEHQPLWDGATGDVLIGGLGLGFVNQKLMDNPFVTSVTIIEKNQEVIDLVWDHCPKDSRFTLVHADIDTWTPPNTSHWDYAWFDTWIGDNSTTQEEYPEFIQSRYGSYCDQIGIWNQLP